MAPVVDAILFTDPGCPWAYSALPALRVLDWRYGPALRWRLVMIGLTEEARQYVDRGYTPARQVQTQREFRDRFGMPFGLVTKPRVAATSPGCRAVVAARLDHPGREWAVLRALQLANFTSDLLLDDPERIERALAGVPGIDARALVARIDDPDVREAYERDRAEARTAAGSAAEAQGKTAATDGPVRFTAPSLVLERDGRRLVAGGWQTVEAYDVLVANLAPEVPRQPPPSTPESLLHRYPEGLTTQEAALLMVEGNDPVDRAGVEGMLLALASAGRAVRRPLGNDALWLPA